MFVAGVWECVCSWVEVFVAGVRCVCRWVEVSL